MMEMNLQFFGGRGSSGGKRSGGGGGGGSSESYSESKLNKSDYRGEFYSMPMGSKVIIENSAAGGRWDGVYTKVQQGNGWSLVNSSGEKIFGHSATGNVTNAMSAVLKKSSVKITVKRKRV